MFRKSTTNTVELLKFVGSIFVDFGGCFFFAYSWACNFVVTSVFSFSEKDNSLLHSNNHQKLIIHNPTNIQNSRFLKRKYYS